MKTPEYKLSPEIVKLLTEIDEAVVMAHHLQVDREKFLSLVKERLDFFERKSGSIDDGK